LATYAIGDVQGCFAELTALVASLNFDPSRDRLWFVGDLVNRGPNSLQVLRYVRSLGDAAVTVLGNHDLHLLALAAGCAKRKNKDTLDEILAAPDRDELCGWLRQRPLLHHDSALGCTLIHAGLPPQWDLATAAGCAAEVENALRNEAKARRLFAHMYGDQPDLWSAALNGDERLRFIVNCFTRLRVCDRQGRVELKYKGTAAGASAGQLPWFKAPGRRSAGERIVFGHWSALGYHDADGVLCIDTGCVWGAKLCAVRLDRPAPPRFVPCSSSGLSVEE